VQAYLWNNIDTYLSEVSLALEGNVEETGEVILEILTHPDVSVHLAIKFALRQNHLFESFDYLPVSMWDELLFNDKVVVDWQSVVEYFSGESVDLKRFNQMLDRPEIYSRLS